eukprot:m.46138 g.46138  ORF g.46138 m.46138 type:complete len:148 (+) comp33673_c0_seq1:109-552(+)
MTLAMVPYPGVSNQNVITLLQAGQRLKKPKECPSELYDTLLQCWAAEPKGRPTFGDIVVKMENYLAELVSYFDPNAVRGDSTDVVDPYANWSLATGYTEVEEKKLENENEIEGNCTEVTVFNEGEIGESESKADKTTSFSFPNPIYV